MRRMFTCISILALLTLWETGCVELPFAPGEAGELGEAERLELAWSLAELAYADGGAPGASTSLAPAEGSGGSNGRAFALSRACPKGGVLRLAGEQHTIVKPDHGTTVVELGGQANPDDCALETRAGTFALDGNPSLKLGARFERNAEGPVGLQKVTLAGNFLWSSGDRGGACEVELQAKWDAATGKRYLYGHFCGTEMNVSVGGTAK